MSGACFDNATIIIFNICTHLHLRVHSCTRTHMHTRAHARTHTQTRTRKNMTEKTRICIPVQSSSLDRSFIVYECVPIQNIKERPLPERTAAIDRSGSNLSNHLLGRVSRSVTFSQCCFFQKCLQLMSERKSPVVESGPRAVLRSFSSVSRLITITRTKLHKQAFLYLHVIVQRVSISIICLLR